LLFLGLVIIVSIYQGDVIMKKFFVFALFSILCSFLVKPADAATCNKWNLPNDFSDDAVSPIIDGCGNQIWFFMQKNDTEYTLLANYVTDERFPQLKAWRGTEEALLPAITKNFGKTITNPDDRMVPFYTGTMELHPGPTTAAVVAWKSPFDGNVDVTIKIVDSDIHCGNGITWNVSKNNLNISSGYVPAIASGTIVYSDSRLDVVSGDVVYIAVDGNGEFGCDATRVEADFVKVH
jgi:hypothetical protein